MVEADMEAVEMLRPGRGDPGDELLRRHTQIVRRQHDRRAVRVVGADEMHFMPLHPLKAHPDVGLDVLHDVADVKRSIGVRQRRRDKKLAARRPTVHLFVTHGGTSAKPCRRQGEKYDSSKGARREYRKDRFFAKLDSFPDPFPRTLSTEFPN